jgi:hypothetical protein
MTGFILFMMFFTSPPAKPGKQVWTLHSTAQIVFPTAEACKEYGIHLQQQMNSTDTVTMRGWCINQATGLSTFGSNNPFKPTESEDKSTFFQIPSRPRQ